MQYAHTQNNRFDRAESFVELQVQSIFTERSWRLSASRNVRFTRMERKMEDYDREMQLHAREWFLDDYRLYRVEQLKNKGA